MDTRRNPPLADFSQSAEYPHLSLCQEIQCFFFLLLFLNIFNPSSGEVTFTFVIDLIISNIVSAHWEIQIITLVCKIFVQYTYLYIYIDRYVYTYRQMPFIYIWMNQNLQVWCMLLDDKKTSDSTGTQY